MAMHYFTHLLLAFLFLLRPANSDFASDEAECAPQLMGLTTCLPYAQSKANRPTPDCCSALKTVITSHGIRCLCILAKDRDNPQLGIQVNATLALTIPKICNVPANVSECPKALNLPPNSPDAQFFKQFADQYADTSARAGKGNSILPHSQNGSATVHASSGAMNNLWSEGIVNKVLLLLVLPLVVLRS